MMTKTIIFALLICFCILPLHAEEGSVFVDDEGEVYLVEGEYYRPVSSYTIHVNDPFSNCISGVDFFCDVSYTAQISEYSPVKECITRLEGTTNSSGTLTLILLCRAYYDDEEPPEPTGGTLTTENLAQQGIGVLIIDEPGGQEQAAGWPQYNFVSQQVFLDNVPSGYTNIGPENAYTNYGTWTEYFLVFNQSDDEDGNGVFDDYELLLAQKFCPNLKLHSGDKGVRPVPVEIMDRNGDNQLGFEDVLVDVYDVSPQFIGTFGADDIEISNPQNNFYYSVLYPYHYANEGMFCYINNVLQVWLLYPHFEWGNNGQTNDTYWYPEWTNKLNQHSSDSKYINGTTYAHLFEYSGYIIIQYYFFYPFNCASNRHEGDWEHINVVVKNQIPESSQLKKVVYYYHHEKTIRTNPELIQATHPRIYIGGETSFMGISGHGSHGSYPNPGIWDTGNLGIDETVDGLGLEIHFDNYQNVVLLPSIDFVNNHNNNTIPFFNSQGINLNWMIFSSFWGQPMSSPSAGETTFSVLKSMVNGWVPFIAGSISIPKNVRNVAPVGPVLQSDWESPGFE